MPIWIVRRRVDAYVNYLTQVVAKSAREAAETAAEEDCDLTWEEEGTDQFDNRVFITLDDEGSEMADCEVCQY